MTTQFDLYQRMLIEQKFHSDMMERMSGSLQHLQGEMRAIRQSNRDAVAIQQQMLQQERLQAYIEEFIYTTQKIVSEITSGQDNRPPVARYFSLRGILEGVKELGLGTSMIRGRDNKAAFEAGLKEVFRLAKALEQDASVADAIKKTEIERKRIADQRALKEATREKLWQRISELKSQRQRPNPVDAVQTAFDAFVNNKPPFELKPLPDGRQPPAWSHWLLLAFLLVPGCGWAMIIPFVAFLLAKGKPLADAKLNAPIDDEISKLNSEVLQLDGDGDVMSVALSTSSTSPVD